MKYYKAIDEQGLARLCNTQAEAKAVNKNFETFEVPADKDALRDFVQDLLSRIDDLHNSADDPVPVAVPVVQDTAQLTRERIEEVWDSLPLSFRFHLCGLTMETARETNWYQTVEIKAKQGYGGKGD